MHKLEEGEPVTGEKNINTNVHEKTLKRDQSYNGIGPKKRAKIWLRISHVEAKRIWKGGNWGHPG